MITDGVLLNRTQVGRDRSMKHSSMVAGVFTELIRELGAKGLQVDELYGLDESLLNDLEPVYGLIFLFKWDAAIEARRKKLALQLDGTCNSPLEANALPTNTFFAQQTVQNACATQAILSILLNIPESTQVDLGDSLRTFKEFSQDLTPDLRGDAIGSSDLIRKVHNSFARPNTLLLPEQDRDSEDVEDPFHFVSFLPIGNVLYEFDGLKSGPIPHGSFERDGAWVGLALAAIREKISEFGEEIRFNLMAVIKDRATMYRETLDRQIRRVCELEDSLRLDPPSGDAGCDPRQGEIKALMMEKFELERRLEEEQVKMTRYQRENALRRHNFVPLALELIKGMAGAGCFDEYLE